MVDILMHRGVDIVVVLEVVCCNLECLIKQCCGQVVIHKVHKVLHCAVGVDFFGVDIGICRGVGAVWGAPRVGMGMVVILECCVEHTNCI